MPHLQIVLMPRGDEHSIANLGSALKLVRDSWELYSTTHEIEGMVQWVSAEKLFYGSKLFSSSFKQVSWEGNRPSHPGVPTLVYSSKLVGVSSRNGEV